MRMSSAYTVHARIAPPPLPTRRISPPGAHAAERAKPGAAQRSARDARRGRDVERTFAARDGAVEHRGDAGHDEEIDAAAPGFLDHQADVLACHRDLERSLGEAARLDPRRARRQELAGVELLEERE